MVTTRRLCVVGIVAVGAWAGVLRDAVAQYGVTDSLPASAVIGGRGNDGYHEQGGVVGPWWSGSGTNAAPPHADGGFWFGLPGMGFGGSQGSTSGMNTFAPTVTTTPGAAGMISDSRLVPFVSGVVPVVGSGYPVTPVTTRAVLPWSGPFVSSIPMRPTLPVASASLAGGQTGMMQPSTPGARDRAKQLVSTGDRSLIDGAEHAAAAKAAVVEYRAASRFTTDDADIEIRQAILYEALGKRRDADRAIARAERIDGRLARPLETVSADAGGFLASPPRGLPTIAARGFVILEEIATSAIPADTAGPAAEPLPILTWLSDSWARRWGTAPGAAMLDAP
jgi:hypothetical protein